MKKIILAENEIYHVYNRGIERRDVFTNKKEYTRAIKLLDYYRFSDIPVRFSQLLDLSEEAKSLILNKLDKGKTLVDVISYCLLPNHFHLLLRQRAIDGVRIYLSKFANSYTKYFNTRHKRVGPLFQGIFKYVHIEDDEQLIHVHRYIHLNPVVSYLIKVEKLSEYYWSSYNEYLNIKKLDICEKEMILDHFKSVNSYKKFIFDQVDYANKLEKIKHLTYGIKMVGVELFHLEGDRIRRGDF